MTDSELRTALEHLHRESYGWALGCCAQKTAEAEDVLQTVYVKVLAGQARYDGKASFKTWLFAVIRRTAAEVRQRQWLRRMLLDQRPVLAAVVEQPDDMTERAELRQRVRAALEPLPRRQREVLQLVFYHELSLAEAAQIMGISLGSARTHYERGKKRLRVQMEDWHIHAEAGRNDAQGAVSATETGR